MALKGFFAKIKNDMPKAPSKAERKPEMISQDEMDALNEPDDGEEVDIHAEDSKPNPKMAELSDDDLVAEIKARGLMSKLESAPHSESGESDSSDSY